VRYPFSEVITPPPHDGCERNVDLCDRRTGKCRKCIQKMRALRDVIEICICWVIDARIYQTRPGPQGASRRGGRHPSRSRRAAHAPPHRPRQDVARLGGPGDARHGRDRHGQVAAKAQSHAPRRNATKGWVVRGSTRPIYEALPGRTWSRGRPGAREPPILRHGRVRPAAAGPSGRRSPAPPLRHVPQPTKLAFCLTAIMPS
jgi:hypothetical protein